MTFVVLLVGCQPSLVGAEGLRDRLKGLVFEAEDWSQPKNAWIENRDTDDHWCLWTTEQDVRAKRSMGASLRSPVVRADRQSPAEGAPPLHTRITGISAGTYRVFANNPGRFIAYSFDGKDWHPGEPGAEIALGVFDVRDGVFELWVDDRFATPANIGPCYYDYIRMEPHVPPELSRFATHRLGDNRLQVSWVSSEPMDTGILSMVRGDRFLAMAKSSERSVRNHRVVVEGPLGTGRVRAKVDVTMGPTYAFFSKPVALELPGRPRPQPPRAQAIPLQPASTPRAERPVLVGVPLPPKQLWQARHVWVEDKQSPLPSQSTVAARWPDGSVKWLFVRFLPGAQTAGFHLHLGPAPPETANAFRVEQTSEAITLGNGCLRLAWRRASFALFGKVDDSKRLHWTGEPMSGDVRIVDGSGGVWGLGSPDQLEIEEAGPVRAVIRAGGPFQDEDGEQRFRYRLRYFVTARSPLVRVELTLIRDAAEPVFQPIESFALRIPLAGDGPLQGQLAGADPVTVTEAGQHELQQVTDKRLRLTVDGQITEQEARCPGWAVAGRRDARIALAVRDFWQTWPKGLALKPDGLHVRILPQLAADEYQPKDIMDWARHLYWFKDGRYLFKRGMALRTAFWVRFDQVGDPVPGGGWESWAQQLLALPYATTPPDRYCASGVFGPCEPARPDAFPAYEDMVERNVGVIFENREEKAEFGWMDFGDWHGERGFNWGNSEYDLAWSMALQFARTGRWDYFELGEQMARHYSTVDTVHAPWSVRMPGRVYAHSIGHVGAGLEPKDVGLPHDRLDDWMKRYRFFYAGAIDAAGHIHQEGTFAYYFLTGDRDYREVAEAVAGAQATYLTARFDFGIERSAGWPLANAVAAYEATGNPFYLNAARLYVERILEKQDPAGGSWLLPQDRTECDHPPPHLGSKSFATGVLLYAMMRYDLVEPRDDVKRSIIRACAWLVEQAWNREKQGFRYKTGCDRYADHADRGSTMALCAAGLAYGWTLKPDPRFREVLSASFAKICQATGSMGKPATMLTRQSAYALPVLRRMAQSSPSSLTTGPSP